MESLLGYDAWATAGPPEAPICPTCHEDGCCMECRSEDGCDACDYTGECATCDGEGYVSESYLREVAFDRLADEAYDRYKEEER